MTAIRTAPARIYVYDIGTVLTALSPERANGSAEWINGFLANTIHNFEIVTVVGVTNAMVELGHVREYQTQTKAIQELWRRLWFPCEISGSCVVLRRVGSSLWIITYDPVNVKQIHKKDYL